MKVFTNMADALKSVDEKRQLTLNSFCPYNTERLCGNWCSLFYFSPGENSGTRNISPYVILGCKVDQKMLYVDSFIDTYEKSPII